MLYSIISTIFGTLFCINNIYSTVSNIIINYIYIIVLWCLLFINILYQNKYINIAYSIITTIIGTIISIYIFINCKIRLYQYEYYKGFTSGIVKNINHNKIIETNIEYIVDNITYSILYFSNKNKFKLNEKLIIIYNHKIPQKSIVYQQENVVIYKLTLLANMIILILLWIFLYWYLL